MRDMDRNLESGQDNLSPDRLLTMLVTSTSDLELLGPGKNEVRSMVPANLIGIDLKAGLHNGTFVYELKVPLAENDSSPYGIGLENGGPIGFGCEIPQIDRSRMREEMAAGGGGGMRGVSGGGMRGGGDRGGMRGGGGSRGMRGGGFERPEQLKMWAIIHLVFPTSTSKNTSISEILFKFGKQNFGKEIQ